MPASHIPGSGHHVGNASHAVTSKGKSKASHSASAGTHDDIGIGGSSSNLSNISNEVQNPFKKGLFGDIFGTNSGPGSMLGMLYRSRVQENLFKKTAQKTEGVEKTEEESSKMGSSVGSVDLLDNDSDSDLEQMEEMNPRQQLAITIRNWSAMAENDRYIINEGAVHALIALAGMEDPSIKKSCATAMYHLSSREGNREDLLSLGATTGIITIAMQVRNW